MEIPKPEHRSHVRKKKLDYVKILSIFIVILIVAAYHIYSLNQLRNDYTYKLSLLENTTNEKLTIQEQSLQEEFGTDILNLRSDVNEDLVEVDTKIDSTKSNLDKRINSVIDIIDKQSETYQQNLDELKEDVQDEIKSIDVKSTDFSKIVDDVIESVVSIATDKGVGSGVIVEDTGFIVTNHHVIEDANVIQVTLFNGTKLYAQGVGVEKTTDVAVIKIPGVYEDLRFDDSDDVQVGERVIAVGNPSSLSFSVTEGIVSALHRSGPSGYNIYLQHDVPINPGNSGGPLINSKGRIIGINTLKIGEAESLGFAIESNTVSDIVDEIIDSYNE